MLIKITHADGHVQVETAFNSIEEAAKALFTHVPEGVKIESDEAVVNQEMTTEEVVKPVAKKKKGAE